MEREKTGSDIGQRAGLLVVFGVCACLYSSGVMAETAIEWFAHLNRRVMALIVLPFLFVLFMLFSFAKKRLEQRKWDKVRREIKKKK